MEIVMKKRILMIAVVISLLVITSCKLGQVTDPNARIIKENEEFLNADNKGGEVFRVLLTSDEYKVVQMKNEKTILRTPDEGGDKYMSNEIDKLNIIDEARTGLITVWLYPDSGKIMKIRSQRPTYFKEVDALLNDDIMRWNFTFPKKVVDPTKFDITYRVVLRKKKADEEIIKSVQDRLKEGN
jgi:hypothetical protein